MSIKILPNKLKAIAETDKIDSYDVQCMRRELFADDLVSAAEAEQLLILDLEVSEKCREWGYYLSEVLVDFTVRQMEPVGIVNDANAKWLIDHISEDGLIDSPEQLEMLVRVLEVAESAPNFLVEFALKQVSRAVLENQGPLALARTSDINVICKSDVEHIRRLMYGFASDGGMAVTKEEAEFLFDLNDKTIENMNDPAWSYLFTRAVGNYLLSTMNNAVPERRIALAEDLWEQAGDNTIDSMVNKLRSIYQDFLGNAKKLEDAYEQNNEALEASISVAAQVTSEEASWVAERIGTDGVLHENEKALLRFLREESPNMHPSMKELVDQAA